MPALLKSANSIPSEVGQGAQVQIGGGICALRHFLGYGAFNSSSPDQNLKSGTRNLLCALYLGDGAYGVMLLGYRYALAWMSHLPYGELCKALSSPASPPGPRNTIRRRCIGVPRPSRDAD